MYKYLGRLTIRRARNRGCRAAKGTGPYVDNRLGVSDLAPENAVRIGADLGDLRSRLSAPVLPFRVQSLRVRGSPRASGLFRRFPVDVEKFEPEVCDSSQQAVQGRLVGAGAPQHRRIAHHAHLRVVEDAPHPGTRDTADGDHIGTIGYFCGLCHFCREPLDGVSCLHPFRVCRPVVVSSRG